MHTLCILYAHRMDCLPNKMKALITWLLRALRALGRARSRPGLPQAAGRLQADGRQPARSGRPGPAAGAVEAATEAAQGRKGPLQALLHLVRNPPPSALSDPP